MVAKRLLLMRWTRLSFMSRRPSAPTQTDGSGWSEASRCSAGQLAAATGGRVVLLLSEIFREAAVLLSRRFRLPANVRLWLLADIHPHSDLRPLYPRKQT